MMMNVHYEACTHLHRTIQQIHAAGMKAGVTLNPSTPVCVLEDIICDVDMVLLMSVNPGFGGQKFIENTIKKVGRLRQLIKESGSQALIEVDGGVQAETAPRLVKAGVNVLVSGSYVFKSTDPYATIHALERTPLIKIQIDIVLLSHLAEVKERITHSSQTRIDAHIGTLGNFLERHLLIITHINHFALCEPAESLPVSSHHAAPVCVTISCSAQSAMEYLRHADRKDHCRSPVQPCGIHTDSR